MSLLVLGLIFIFLLFSFVIMFGAPYLPTLKPQAQTALELLDLKKGERLLELGSGDGKILRMAAQQGIKSIGIELNPILVLYSRLRNWRYRSLMTIKWGNFWTSPLPQTEAIYVFLHTRFMQKLDKKIIQESTQPVKLVSYAFEIPNKKATRTKNGLFLYYYKPLASQRGVK